MKEHILVVDDEVMIRTLLVDYLSGEGFVCHEAGGSEEAFRIVEEKPISLALLDINMPGPSGIYLLGELKKRRPELQGIMVTAEDDLKTAMYCIEKGASDYLVKPFRVDRLLKRMNAVLEKRRLMVDSQANPEL
jgi:two-component system phosphate regulon response regulator OmpR